MVTIELSIAQTVGAAALCLVIGELIKSRVGVLSRYFIPSPIIGGLVFSLALLVGHLTQTFDLTISEPIKEFLLIVFFTTIGFSASFELLKKGGVAVALFLGVAIVLVISQNFLGVGLAYVLGADPLLGLAAGSISMTGGHGTSAAFGPTLAEMGLVGALPAAIAASTWGLIAGCMIGGPIGRRLMNRYNLKGPSRHQGARTRATQPPTAAHTSSKVVDSVAALEDTAQAERSAQDADAVEKRFGIDSALYGTILLAFAVGLGSYVTDALSSLGISIPIYIGAMLVAAVFRNLIDMTKLPMPDTEISVMGNISLALFLAMALMSMKLWELADVFGPLVVILIGQTVLMAAYAYFVTFKVMGKDYDAAVMANGHCGFGMGATPNAMANMQAFTEKNGDSRKAFFVIPLVGSLFIDFMNITVITTFMHILG